MLGSGGDVTTGGRLQFAASGANFNYGGLQNVIVGERGAELMQVGKNGVRVFSNQQTQSFNQMGQQERYGGAMMAIRIEGELRGRGRDLVVTIDKEKNIRRGRTF
jgi:hypothetical protein